MKRLLLSLLLLATLTGCTRRYVVTLNNGNQITSNGKPKSQDGGYVIKDANGQEVFVSGGRVREIAPASMASPSGGFKFNPTPKK